MEATTHLTGTQQSPEQESPKRGHQARLVGLDVARGLAVFGMFAAHVMPPTYWPSSLASGRAAALFAVLAGVSISLLSGGSRPHAGTRMRTSRVRIAVRAVLLFLLGLGLTTLQVPAMVILAFYGVLFLLSIPLLRLRAAALAILAAVLAVGAPLLSYVLRGGVETNRLGYTPDFGDFGSLDGFWTAVHSLLLTGAYPVLTWLPFLLTGMSLGRLDLLAVRGKLIAVGAGLAALGYGGSWIAMNPLGGHDVLLSTLPPGLPPKLLDAVLSSSMGTAPTTSPVWLLTAGAHSGTPFDIVGASGVAIAVIGACLFGQRLRGPLLPVSSVGALALTSYAGHLLVLKAVGAERMGQLIAEHPYVPWLALMVGTAVLTIGWRVLLGRGPLEWALHHASTAPARLLAR
ncbi:heparan-alpha-glucosaminide N-acetyltransferase domain-containing protein [Saccharopolyspora halophila]|uniref:heparan-alpha-glucosaminide N-acetyltransferase domain-containing protein n=1 Tax=Saccharopolyspora halophila TaxID=405551 RepID=UPI0031DBA0FF